MKTKNILLPKAFLLVLAIIIAGCSSKLSDSDIKETVLKPALLELNKGNSFLGVDLQDVIKIREFKVVNVAKNDDTHYTADIKIDWEFIKNYGDYDALQRLTLQSAYGDFKKGEAGNHQELRVKLAKGDRGWMVENIIGSNSSVAIKSVDPKLATAPPVSMPFAEPWFMGDAAKDANEAPYLTAKAFDNLPDANKYEAQLFKFMPDFIDDNNKLKVWVAINSCVAASKVGNEFEWPAIAKRYKDAYKQIADQIPATLTLQFNVYLGEYNMEANTFPVYAYINSKQPFVVSTISIEGGYKSCGRESLKAFEAWQPVTKVNLDRSMKIESVPVLLEAAKAFVATHQDVYSRRVVLSLEADIIGATAIPNMIPSFVYAFSASPTKVVIKSQDGLVLSTFVMNK